MSVRYRARPGDRVSTGCAFPGGALLHLVVAAAVIFSPAAEAQTISPGVFADELSTWNALATACANDARDCDPGKIPDQQDVGGAIPPGYKLHWGWLQEALRAARTAKAADRATSMAQVRAHLATLGTDAGATSAQPVAFERAPAAAKAVLARKEFRYVEEGPGWFARQIARMQDGLFRLFTGFGHLGDKAPWLAPAIEWACFGTLAAGLLWWLRRGLQRQAVRLSLEGETALHGGGKRRKSADWMQKAKESAAAEQWRDAVHFLYWGAIALLEERRAWKPHAARTPREFVRLLQPGSEAARVLRGLTGEFEQAWYGSRSATEGQYRAALASVEALGAARLERAPADASANGTRGPFAPVGDLS